ncbi:hypothetical protein AbraIFM66950_011238 [Aspergillus brasiliensis]|nr:hypothetical protein AbraIFM66950_011238 [Aspergillus brasiliensis]
MSLTTPPPITLEDLHAFQAKHFPGSNIIAAHQTQPVTDTTTTLPETNYNEGQYYWEEEEWEDDLGYYPDGVKRTLTDEQIRIFRHSEIHALRREKELREEEEADAVAAAAAEAAERESAVAAGADAGADANTKTGARTEQQASKSRIEEKEKDTDVNMDYGDDDGGSSNITSTSKATSTSRPVPQFTGRRIISYDD